MFLVVTAAGLTADLASKHRVFERFLSGPEVRDHVRRLQAAAEANEEELPPELVLRSIVENTDGRRLMPGIRLTPSANPGVVFGLMLPRWFVAAATVVTMAMVCVFFATSPKNAWALHLGLAFILGGALGNLYDRLFSAVVLPENAGVIRHHVRDFVDCAELHYPWVFNVADVLLVLGVGLLLACSFLPSQRAGGK